MAVRTDVTPGQLGPEQKQIAQRIIDIGVELGASQRDIAIALTTANRESDIRNLQRPSADGFGSYGVFQGRASDHGQGDFGYGTREQIVNDVDGQIRKFYLGTKPENNAGLLQNANRDNMSWEAAAKFTQGFAPAHTSKYSETSMAGQTAKAILAGQVPGINPAPAQQMPATGGALYGRGRPGYEPYAPFGQQIRGPQGAPPAAGSGNPPPGNTTPQQASFVPQAGDPSKRVEWRGVTLDERTAEMMKYVDQLLPDVPIRPTQGSFSSGVKASAGTHNGPGAIDLSVRGLTRDQIKQLVQALIDAGFAAWYRDEGFSSPHIHAIAKGTPGLPPLAEAQVRDFEQGRSGLRGHLPEREWDRLGVKHRTDVKWEDVVERLKAEAEQNPKAAELLEAVEPQGASGRGADDKASYRAGLVNGLSPENQGRAKELLGQIANVATTPYRDMIDSWGPLGEGIKEVGRWGGGFVGDALDTLTKPQQWMTEGARELLGDGVGELADLGGNLAEGARIAGGAVLGGLNNAARNMLSPQTPEGVARSGVGVPGDWAMAQKEAELVRKGYGLASPVLGEVAGAARNVVDNLNGVAWNGNLVAPLLGGAGNVAQVARPILNAATDAARVAPQAAGAVARAPGAAPLLGLTGVAAQIPGVEQYAAKALKPAAQAAGNVAQNVAGTVGNVAQNLTGVGMKSPANLVAPALGGAGNVAQHVAGLAPPVGAAAWDAAQNLTGVARYAPAAAVGLGHQLANWGGTAFNAAQAGIGAAGNVAQNVAGGVGNAAGKVGGVIGGLFGGGGPKNQNPPALAPPPAGQQRVSDAAYSGANGGYGFAPGPQGGPVSFVPGAPPVQNRISDAAYSAAMAHGQYATQKKAYDAQVAAYNRAVAEYERQVAAAQAAAEAEAARLRNNAAAIESLNRFKAQAAAMTAQNRAYAEQTYAAQQQFNATYSAQMANWANSNASLTTYNPAQSAAQAALRSSNNSTYTNPNPTSGVYYGPNIQHPERYAPPAPTFSNGMPMGISYNSNPNSASYTTAALQQPMHYGYASSGNTALGSGGSYANFAPRISDAAYSAGAYGGTGNPNSPVAFGARISDAAYLAAAEAQQLALRGY